MNAVRFVETRRAAWDRMEALMKGARGRGARALSQQQLRELMRLYPALAVDVARARTLNVDIDVQRRINRLAIAAHGLLYRRAHVRSFLAIWRFLSRDYPRLFRRLWVYTALATLIFLLGGVGAYVSSRISPASAFLFVPGTIELRDRKPGTSEDDVSAPFRAVPGSPMAARITTNNISVAFYAFAFGIMLGLGTCYVLLFNGMMLGGFAGHFANHGLSFALWSFLLPHGVLELMAIMVAGGAGLRLGLSVAVPKRLTRGASLRVGAREAVLLVLGTIPMFIIAGLIEGFITPTYLDGRIKIVLGVTMGLVALGWLLTVACERPTADVSP